MSNEQEIDDYIQSRYKNAIDFYWASSRANKHWYKATRSLTVIVGALVTLIASLASSTIIADTPIVKAMFDIGTPILAAVLTIIAGFSQSFQWGSAWQNMVLTAQQLQREYDRYLVTPMDEKDFSAEAKKVNDFVVQHSETFFDRMLGCATKTKTV